MPAGSLPPTQPLNPPPRPQTTHQVQDTIPICPSTLSQHVALAALQHGGEWVASHVADLMTNREAISAALQPLREAASRHQPPAAADGSSSGGSSSSAGVFGGEGAIYFWARLPRGFERRDEEVVAWLIRAHGVCVIPGSACGAPGHIRVAFANLTRDQCAEAAARLRRGLGELVAGGPAVLGAAAAAGSAGAGVR